MGIRITANQVTLARLLLLPLPMVMIYRGTHAWMIAALAIYVLLGLTDALDGILARRYGGTPLGELLDPVADKIFLVAGFLPLSDFRVAPPILILLLFVRELAITALRSIALEEGLTFRTTRIAKLKTTVQMAGAGFILLIWLFPADRTIHAVMGCAAAASLIPAVVELVRGRVPGWKPVSAAVLIVGVFAARLFFPPDPANVAIMVVIVAFTLYSGVEYVWGMRAVLAARFRRSPLESLRLLGLSIAVPVSFLPALNLPVAPSFLIAGILAAELAAGGLDNSLVQAGITRGPVPDLCRSGVQALGGLGVEFALHAWNSLPAARVAASAALVYTLADFGIRLVRNWNTFRFASPPADGPGAGTPSRNPGATP